ncbi:MAG TPA: aminopeptidase [Bacteroidetes bacterium]|nr:aminopeptidase [Ignavibacteria bacterium]HCA43501.1 aminopeptidase [Bacteroidota bacterium]HCN37530.1 aminopeptidase [Bacteroidota bacterium]
MNSEIQNVTFDSELSKGAYNAVNACLRLKPTERVTIITDNEDIEIAAALAAEIKKVGSEFSVMVMEDYAPRPLKNMPKPILEDLAKSQVSIFCAQAKEGELRSRIDMTDVVDANKIRHAHMVNITKQIMLEGMRADYSEVDDISQRLIEKARRAKKILVKSDNGTDMIAEFTDKIKWLKTSGIISVEKWGNLPGGEIFTSPLKVDGTFVVDGVVGDYLCAKYGDLINTPLKIEIADSRITRMECDNKELLEEFTEYTMTDENSNRVGEYAIGTNLACKKVIGNILQDEKLPTIHIAFGHPYSKYTGADWVSTTHIDCVSIKCSIWFDYGNETEQVMEKGKFLI